MARYDRYLEYANETSGDGIERPATPTGSANGAMGSKTPNLNQNQTDPYELAKQQEYGLLFDREVALENAKANALKYTQNQINAQGLGGTGYGSSLQSGIYNTYMNKVNEAQNQYAENVGNINLQQAQEEEAKANDRFQSVTTMLTQADSVENMNQLLEDYGYGSIDPTTKEFKWGEKPAGMSDDDWFQMQYYYRMASNYLGSGSSAENLTDADSKRADEYYSEMDKYQQGSAEYNQALARGNYNKMRSVGFYVQGLGSGVVNDDIDITIGSNERDTGAEFDLKVDEVVSDADLIKILNYSATGSTDNISKEGTGWFMKDTRFSGKSNGNNHLVLYNNQLYIYTRSGWCRLGSDHSDINKAIQAFKDLGVR